MVGPGGHEHRPGALPDGRGAPIRFSIIMVIMVIMVVIVVID